jgi:hypothetical protein
MQTLSAPTSTTLDDLAYRVAEGGVDVDRAGVSRVVRRAASLGASPVLIDVVTDPFAPPVARQRAFGALLALVDRGNYRASIGESPSAASAGSYTWPARAA